LGEVNFAGELIDEGVAGLIAAVGEVLAVLTAFFLLDGAASHARARPWWEVFSGGGALRRELFVICVLSCQDPFMDHREEELHFWMSG
jgi:hypothetical protein